MGARRRTTSLTVTADGSGNWVADFSGLTDLTYASDGNSMQTDADGDATWDFWQSPRFGVSPVHDWVGSMSPWAPGSTVSLTIEDGSGVLYSDSQTVDARTATSTSTLVASGSTCGVVTSSPSRTASPPRPIRSSTCSSTVWTSASDTVVGRGVAGMPVDVFVHDGRAPW